MDESEDNLCSEDMRSADSALNNKTKPKKRSLIERELETSLTAKITSPVNINDGSNTSRYGRARRLKSETDQVYAKQASSEIKSPLPEKSPIKTQNQSPVYKMHASNTPQKRSKSPINIVEKFLDNQIENIYQENKSLSRFTNEDDSSITPSPGKKYPKVYIRKDLIQKREPEDTVMVIQNMFSPVKSAKKSTNTHLNNILERSCERYSLNSKQQNGYIDNSSVVKTLDFDSKKKKKESKDNKPVQSKGELFELEAQCPYQVGDLAWARMGTYPFWPSIVTRDPINGLFVKKKLFGRIERDVIHVTFFGDNGRRSWIVDNMLRQYRGLSEFKSTRENFTPQDKKKDPRLYAAYFVSEKKQPLWNTSVEEAEALLKEPKRFRIDIFNDMLIKSRSNKIKQPKSKMSRTDSDVSLSESLYDSLFSEDDGKPDNNDKSKNRSRNKSLDMFEVVTACLDNMAAKTGIPKIQRQSHMDRWLQKAKSKTPEKTKVQMQAPIKKLEEKKESKISNINSKEKSNTQVKNAVQGGYSLRKRGRVPNDLSKYENDDFQNRDKIDFDHTSHKSGSKDITSQETNGLGMIIKVESLAGKTEKKANCSVDINTTCESETFTDESIDCSNNNTTNETMSEYDKSKSDHNLQDISQNTRELINTCDATESVKNENVSKDNVDEPGKSNACLDKNVISAECLNQNKGQISASQNSVDFQKDTDDTNSKNISDLKKSSEYQYSSNPSSTDLRNPSENLQPEKSNHAMELSVSEKMEVIHNVGFQQELSDDIQLKKRDSNEVQILSNLTSIITDKHSDDIISSHTKDMQNQSSIINDNSIKGHKPNEPTYEENLEPSTSNSKEKCLQILQEYIVRNKEENEVDNMSVDEDSDSERLPYSPLSNLGNNSDDNLSLDDVPFIEGNISELESQNPASENLNTSDANTDLVNNEIIVTKNLSNDSKKYTNQKIIDILEDESKVHNNNLTKTIQLSKHLNGEIDTQYTNVNIITENLSNDSKKYTNQKIIDILEDESKVHNKNFTETIQLSKHLNGEIDTKCTNENIITENLSNDSKKYTNQKIIDILEDESKVHNNNLTETIQLSKHLNGEIDTQCTNENIITENLSNDSKKYTNQKIIHILEDESKVHNNNLTETIRLSKHLNVEIDTQCTNENIIKENLSNDSKKNTNQKIIDTLEDESKVNNNNLTETIQLSKHLNVEIDTQCTNENTNNKHKEFSNVESETTRVKDDFEKKLCNGYRGQNVRELNLRTKEVRIYVSDCIPKARNENGFHNMTKDLDVETMSINSEDSVVLSKSDSKRTLRSQKENKQEDPFKNPEFMKYMELRQDAILDENPELNENDVKEYLFKTWLYEQNVKSDVMKNDEMRECNLVKGLNQAQSDVPARKTTLSLKKNQLSKTGTLKMFLRRKKDKEPQSNSDDISTLKKRGLKKNMIKDDDDDDHLIGNKNEWHILPVKAQNDIHSSPSSDENKDINKIQNITESARKEELKSKDIHNSDIILEVKESDTMHLTDKSEKITHNVTCSQGEIASTESLVIIRSPPTESNEKLTLTDVFNGNLKDSEDNEPPLAKCALRPRTKADLQEESVQKIIIEDGDTISINSEESEISTSKRKKKFNSKKVNNAFEDPAFVKYLELRQDAVVDEHPELTHDDIVSYLYQTWLYEENMKSDIKKTDEIEQSTMVKGLTDPVQQPKKVRRKVPKTEKDVEDDSPSKPKRKSVKPFYNEEYSDIEDELEVFEIFKPRNVKPEGESSAQAEPISKETEVYNEVELYFAELTKPKPNIFKGLIREKVCEICEKIGSLVKCKGCNGMFHLDCVKKQVAVVEVPITTPKGRKKKKKLVQKSKNFEDVDNDHDVSEENNVSIEEILEASSSHTVDADVFESQLSVKMQEILNNSENVEYDSYSSDDCLDWNETVPGKCEIIDIKLKPRVSVTENDYSEFKCNDCQKYDTPICFVCKGAVSSKQSAKRQNCNVAHCHKYYHLECLEHWPQTQFNGGEPSKNNKKFNEHFEAFTCPRHVCHTCVSDDPRGCKTRFSGDKLARCVKCPATYHSFTKCLPAGSQILTASHIICPRHHESRPGKAPCHVNTGWCFICALGGSLICCEYCPTSFHAECLNINPPEGGYMCEDCETGRLPLYGEMVWVKLGHYRWWPGIILHPYEIPENLLTVKHSPGEFVVRFFGQYDHYWVNRGRVFPFQEGDSGRISNNKSKIDAAFITAVEHAQRACEILKTAQPNQEESLDIASSLLPPHYVKLKVNKPCGSLCGRKLEDPESSLTQCECNQHDEDPCGPYSQCLNRMLLTECGPVCRAGDRCNNRAFEKRLYPKLVPYRTPSRGWGLKTLEDIKAGQFVIEYVGELIDEEEFRRRMRRKHEMRDENFYFLTLDKERMIDAGPKGNLARFMNHCCEPNCETQKWTVLGDVRVGLFALYDIPAQSEVTFNYNLECAGIDKKRCMCGAKRCSGYIGAKPKQEESQTKKNRMHPTKRTYKKRKSEESPSTKNKIKRPLGRPPKPKELTEIEKDLLIIRNATNSLSSDESSRSISSEHSRHPKTLKRKRVSSERNVSNDAIASPDVKKSKLVDKLEGD